jgi:hypothetical protein
VQLHGLFFQFAHGMKNFPALLQQHLTRTSEAGAVPGTIEDLDIEIAFEFMHGVAQRGGRFKQLCRRSSKAALFNAARV